MRARRGVAGAVVAATVLALCELSSSAVASAAPTAVVAPAADSPAPAGWQTVPAANAVSSTNPSPYQNDGLSSVSCAAGACMAVGHGISTVNGFTATTAMAEREDGGGWKLTPTAHPGGITGDQLTGVSCAAADNCVAVGNAGGGFEAGQTPLAERWDGSTWEQSVTKLPGTIGSSLAGVACPAVDQCMAVGTQVDGTTDVPVDDATTQMLSPAAGSYADPATGVLITGQSPGSADGRYAATWTPSSPGLFDVTVTRNGSTQPLVSTEADLGGFSPSSNAFATYALNNSGQLTVQLFHLTSNDTGPLPAIWTISPTVTSARIAFSPSGHYLFVGYTTATQTFLDVADATAVDQRDANVFSTGGITLSGPPGPCGSSDGDKCGSLLYGFGPDDSRFYYAYIGSGGDKTEWRWTDLAKPSPQPVWSFETASTSGFGKFSPGGAYLAVVSSTGTATLTVYLFASDGGQNLGVAGPVSGASAPDLHATLTDEIVTISGVDHQLTPNHDLVWTVKPVPTPTVAAPDGVSGGHFDGDYLAAVSCVARNDCVAVGGDQFQGSSVDGRVFYGGPMVAHWDGTAWTIVYQPASSTLDIESGAGAGGVSCVAAAGTATGDACFVTGFAVSAPKILRLSDTGGWTSWKLTSGPQHTSGADYNVSGVDCVAADDCTAAGAYRVGGTSGSNATYLAHWDGTAWSLEDAPTFDAGSFYSLFAVDCAGSAECVTVGTGPGAASVYGQVQDERSAVILSEGQGWDTSLTASPSSATYGTPVTYTLHLDGPGDGIPSGLVSFHYGQGSCNAWLDAGTATCTTASTSPALSFVTADLVFSTGSGTDAALSGRWSTPIGITPAPSTVTAHVSPSSVTAGDTVTYSATVAVPTTDQAYGTVDFTAGATPLCTAFVSSGSGTCTSTAAPIGTDTITASYPGTTEFASGSGTTSLTVAPASSAAATTTDVIVTPSSTTLHHSVTYSATVSSTTGTPTGTVDFSTGTVELCAATLSGGSGSCRSNDAPAGDVTVTGRYSGDVAHDVSTGTAALTVDASDAVRRIFVGNAGSNAITSYTDEFDGDHRPTGTITRIDSRAPNDPAAEVLDGAGNLWVANCGSDRITEYPAAGLESSGAVVPIAGIGDDGSGNLSCPHALAFDGAGNLWVANADSSTVTEYTGAQLAMLTSAPAPSPAVTIADDPTGYAGGDSLRVPVGLAFDAAGDLWVSNSGAGGGVMEYTPDQLVTGAPAPAVARSTSYGGSLAFDDSGDLWVGEQAELAEYIPDQLTSDDSSPAAVLISNGYADAIERPGQIAFDSGGDLWVASSVSDAVSEFTPAQLATSSSVRPHRVIRGHDTGLHDPTSLVVQDATASTGAAHPDPVSVTRGDTVTYAATVSGSGGTPTGTVAFRIGDLALCTATLSGGAGSCTSSAAPIGSDDVDALYSGDETFAGADLTAGTVDVAPPPTTTTVTVTPDPVPAGRNLLVQVAVTPAGGSEGVPTGPVDVTIGTDAACTAPLDASAHGECTAPAPVDAGDATVSAAYSGDHDNAGSTGTTPLTVGAPEPLGDDVIVGNVGSGTLTSYPQDADGATVPDTTIGGDGSGGLQSPQALARDAAGDVWVANCYDDTIAEYTPIQLETSGTPTPAATVTANFGCPGGLVFDGAGDLWVDNSNAGRIVELTPGQLATGGSPVPAVTIGDDGSGTLITPRGLAFDGAGTLWVAEAEDGALLGYRPAQLAASGSPKPAVVLRGAALQSPDGLAFDASGRLWVGDRDTHALLAYTPAQLSASGSPDPAVVISDDGNEVLDQPGQLGFDAAGRLWLVTPFGVLRYAADQLTASASPTPEAVVTGELTQLSDAHGLVVPGSPAPPPPPPVSTVPSAPRSPQAVAGNARVTVKWSAPASNGGSPVTAYRVRKSTNGTSWSLAATTTATHATVSRLRNGRRYYFDVLAVNAVGVSNPSSRVSAVPATTPSAPRSLAAKPRSGAALVTWRAPYSAGGAPVVGYVVQWARCNLARSGCRAHSELVRLRSVTIRRLAHHRRYYVRVAARNRVGRGRFTSPVTVTPH